MPATCSVINCVERFRRGGGVKMYSLPSERDTHGRTSSVLVEQRRKWISAINRMMLPKKVYVCSKHFLSGKPSKDPNHLDFVPSQQMGYKQPKVKQPFKSPFKSPSKQMHDQRDRHRRLLRIDRDYSLCSGSKMETGCECAENIFIRDEWLEDVVYTRTDEVGGFQHIHVNQALIRAVTSLDHDYSVQKVKIESELQDCQNNDAFFIEKADEIIHEGKTSSDLPVEDHRSEDTLTADDNTDEVENNKIGVLSSDGNGQSGNCKIIKQEQHDHCTNEGKHQIDVHKNNYTPGPNDHYTVRETIIKKECLENINDDAMIDEFNTRMDEGKNDHSTLAEDQWSEDEFNTRMDEGKNDHSTLADDQWSEETLTASEPGEDIDDGWNSEDCSVSLSPGEFIEEIDGWTDDTHDPDGHCSTRDIVIRKECDIVHSTYNITKFIDKFCSNKKESGAERDDHRAVDTGDNGMPLSPCKFSEVADDDWYSVAQDSNGKLSVHSTVNNKYCSERTREDSTLNKQCTIEAKPSSRTDDFNDRPHSSETDSVGTNNSDDEWICSVPEDYGDYEEYDFSLDPTMSSTDSDESWSPYMKRKRYRGRKDRYVCHSCGYKCRELKLLKRHKKSSKTCENPYECNLCNKRYLSKFSLKKHMKTHSESNLVEKT